jgi:hypothetical protein
MSITTLAAANLATSYYDVMVMVDRQSSFHLPVGTSPRAALEKYLQACKVCGVRLHNDGWEARAETVVDELSAKRRTAMAKMLRR